MNFFRRLRQRRRYREQYKRYEASLPDKLRVVIASVRSVREYSPIIPQLVDRQSLRKEDGTDWKEVFFSKMSDNP